MNKPKTQSSLLHEPSPGSNLPEWTVGEASRLVKKTVEETFGLVRIRGEISEFKIPSSGHMYLTLKDEEAVLASVCWRGQAASLGLKPEIGMEVVATGRLTTYMGQSKYQLIIENMALAGIGALLKLLEQRKQKLAMEGLFDAGRKKPLPYLPSIIGVVTSPSGAVIRDILHRLEDRFPRHVLLWPVAVQGEGAAEQIAAAIRGFNRFGEPGMPLRPDVIIVARGGGSVEDLMPFNEEIVVRAAAESQIPLISAVGHETDTTLIDLASDVRAPTPSAAAEMVVPVRQELLNRIFDIGGRFWQGALRKLSDEMERLANLSRSLGDPQSHFETLTQRLDERSERFEISWQSYFERRRAALAEAQAKLRHPRDVMNLAQERLISLGRGLAETWRRYDLYYTNQLTSISASLENLSPLAVLGRGYTLVKSNDGRLITRHDDAQSNESIDIIFYDGVRKAVIND